MRFDIWATDRAQAANIKNLALVLRGGTDEKPTVKMWYLKAKKPFAHYMFRSIEQRENYIETTLEKIKKHKESIAERKKARAGTPEQINSVTVGDIFHWSWGYEQTNCDFFQVIEKTGSTLVLKKLANLIVDGSMYSHGMACNMIAKKNNFATGGLAETITKKLQFTTYGGKTKAYISFPYGWCELWSGRPVYNSWYA